MPGPYAGVRVLDCTQGLAGPMASMYLADFGADVVKVETPAGDYLADDPGYLCVNRGKQRTVIDLDDATDRGEFRRLIRAADVTVFDWDRGELERMACDAATLRAERPELIHAWVPPFAPCGRWSHLPPDPLLLAAVSGISDYHRASSDRPVSPVVPVIAYGHGALAAAGIAAALFARRRSGEGNTLVVSGLHAVAAMQAAVVVDAPGIVSTGREAKRGIANLPNYAAYRCRDGLWLYIGALTEEFFLQALHVLDLVEVMALPGVDGVFANVLKPEVAAALLPRLQERFAQRSRDEWYMALDQAGVPVAPVATRDEWFASETVAANGMRLSLDSPELGPVELPGIPVVLSETPGQVRHLPGKPVRPDTVWTEARVAGDVAAPPSTLEERPLPLDGLRVVDGASFVAGCFGPSILCHYGASVVKVEPISGDPYRLFSISFTAINQGKRSVALDLNDPGGRAALLALLRDADVFVENLRPRSSARLGLTWNSTRQVNSRLVHCSVSAFGSGPLADKPGFDPLVQARSGLLAAQGGSDEPGMSSMIVHDIGTGTMAAIGMLAALYHRETTGGGQHVATSLAHSSLMLQASEFTSYRGRTRHLSGSLDWPGPNPIHRLYACADGWIMLAGHPSQETDIARAVGGAAGPDGPSSAALETALAVLTVEEALDRLDVAGVAAARVLSRHAVFTDPWLLDNDFYHLIDDPKHGTCRCIRTVTDWPESSGSTSRRGFVIGQDTTGVLVKAGYSPSAIAQLLQSGAARAPGPSSQCEQARAADSIL